MRSDREKAEDRSIPGPYKELAVEIRRLLGFYGDDVPLLSARQAALRSEVNHATISGLISGARASRSSLRQLALKLGGDEELLLRLAGYAVNSSSIDKSDDRRAKYAWTASTQLPARIYHRIERLSESDLLKLDRLLEVWVDDGHDVGT